MQIIHNEIYDTGNAAAPARACTSAATTRRARSRTASSRSTTSTTSAATQGDGIEIKRGAHDNIVRDNVIVRSNYPGITMYGFAGAGGPNIVERNLVWHGKADNGIQIVGQIIVRNNIVLDAAITGIASKPSQNATRPTTP